MAHADKTQDELIAENAELRQQNAALQAERDALVQIQSEYYRSLRDASHELVTEQNPDTLLHVNLTRVCTILQADGGFLFVRNADDDDRMWPRAAAGTLMKADLSPVQPDAPLLGQVLQTGEPHLVAHYPGQPARLPFLPAETRVLLLVPVKIGAEVVGVAGAAYTTGDRAFFELDTHAMESFASIASITLSNLRLYSGLQRNRALLEKITSTTPDILYVHDLLNNKNVYVNKALERLLGLAVDDFVGAGPELLAAQVHPEDMPPVRKMIAAFRQGALDSSSQTVRLQAADGAYLWFQARHTVLTYSEDGRPSQVLGVLQDITQRKQAENAVLRSDTRFYTIFESAPVGMAFVQRDGRFLQTNPAFRTMIGYDQASLARMNFRDLTVSEDLVREEPLIQQVVEGKRTGYTLEKRFIRSDGAMIWAHIVSSVIREDDADYGLAVIQDVTERRQAEQTLRQSETRFRTLIDTVPLMVFIFQNGEITYVNPPAPRVTGYSRGDLLGDAFMDTLSAESRSHVRHQIWRYEAGQDYDSQFEVSFFTHDGKLRWMDVTLRPIEIDGGPALLGTGLDVTERKHSEEQQLALALEKERVRVLANFVRDAGHDFRTPLSTINTGIYLLRRIKEPEKRDAYLDILQEQAGHLDKLVDDLLTLSQLDSGMNMTFTSVNLNPLLYDLRDDVSQTLTEKDQTVVIQPGENVPPVKADTMQLYRALRELVKNAVHYTPVGGTITLRTYANAEGAHVVIHDTGDGIPQDKLSLIFERFYRSDEARGVGGLGLGLSIARQVIRYHSGEISVTSAESEGATFTVRLPTGESPKPED